MLELQGKFGTAKVFTDVVDNESISQVINLLNQPYIEGSKVRMMPDIHAGAGCTIGTTMTIKDIWFCLSFAFKGVGGVGMRLYNDAKKEISEETEKKTDEEKEVKE